MKMTMIEKERYLNHLKEIEGVEEQAEINRLEADRITFEEDEAMDIELVCKVKQ